MKKFVKSGLTLVLSVCTSLVVSNAVLAHGPRIYQAPPQVTIYADANFQGASQTLREGWYDIGQLRIGNDTLSSVKVPDGWRVTLYADANYRGRTKTLRSDNSFVADFNDLTSSIRVEKGRFAEPERPRFEPAVTIYADANYQGSSQTLKEGWYNINQLTIGNDILSSVKVPDGWRVTLYEDADYRGRSKTLRSDNSFVADFNDLTSSIRVERGGFAEPERPRFEPQVTIYADANYQGASQTLKEGWYNINQLTIGNDILSSVKVPEGWRVTLYADADYRGSIKTLWSDNAFVADFNDLTSSIRVEYVGRRR